MTLVQSIVGTFGPMPNVFILYDIADAATQLDPRTYAWYGSQLEMDDDDFDDMVKSYHQDYLQNAVKSSLTQWIHSAKEFNDYFESCHIPTIPAGLDAITFWQMALTIYDSHFLSPLRHNVLDTRRLSLAAKKGLEDYMEIELAKMGYDAAYLTLAQAIGDVINIAATNNLVGKKPGAIKRKLKPYLKEFFPPKKSLRDFFIRLISAKYCHSRIRTETLLEASQQAPNVEFLLKLLSETKSKEVAAKILPFIDVDMIQASNTNPVRAAIILAKWSLQLKIHLAKFIPFIQTTMTTHPDANFDIIDVAMGFKQRCLENINLFLQNKTRHYAMYIASVAVETNKMEVAQQVLEMYPFDENNSTVLVFESILQGHMDMFGFFMSRKIFSQNDYDMFRLGWAIMQGDMIEVMQFKHVMSAQYHDPLLVRADNVDIFQVFYPTIHLARFAQFTFRANLLTHILRNQPDCQFDSTYLNTLFSHDKNNRRVLFDQYKWTKNEYLAAYTWSCKHLNDAEMAEFLDVLEPIIFAKKDIVMMNKIMQRTIRHGNYNCFRKVIAITPDNVCYNLDSMKDFLLKKTDIIFHVLHFDEPKIVLSNKDKILSQFACQAN